MKIRLYKMVLHNFRQYGKQTVIKYPLEGLIGILGPNGGGKSTLFNAIGWCFYGKMKDVNKDLILNDSANAKEDCFVELFFNKDGVKYHVKRDLKKTNECFIKTADGTPYAIGASNLTDYIEENLFKMDYNAFCACYYAEQNDFDNLVKLTPAKRVQTISKLLRIDDIDKAADTTRKEYRGIKVEVDESRKHLRNEQDLKESRNKIKQEVKAQEKIIKKMNTDIMTLDNEYKNELVRKSEGEKDYQKYKELQNIIINTSDKIETLYKRSLEPNNKEFKQLSELKKRYDEIEKYKKVFHVLKKQKEDMVNARGDFREKISLQKELANTSAELKKYTEEHQKLTDEIKPILKIEQLVSEKEKEIVNAQSELSTLLSNHQEDAFIMESKKEKIKELKELNEKFDVMGTDSPCPTCERPLGEHYEEKKNHIKEEVNSIINQVSEVQKKQAQLGSLIKEKQNILKLNSEELNRMRNELMRKNSLNERIAFINNEMDTRNSKKIDLSISFEKLKDIDFDEEKFKDISMKLEKANKLYEEILRIENLIQKLPSLEETLEEIRAEIETQKTYKSKVEKEFAELNFDELQYSKIDKKVNKLQEFLSLKKEEKTKNEYNVKILKKDIDLVEEKMAENKKMLLSIKEKEKEMVILGKLDVAFKQYKSDILSKLAPTLSDIMSEDIEAMTNGKYNQIELDDDYNIFIYRKDKKRPLSFFSGGEKKLAALCQRLAISGLLVNQTGQADFDLLAMDEVFGAMDNERQDNVVDMLRNLNQKFPQILIVTHSENVKELFDYVIEIKQDSSDNSTFKWLTEWDTSEVDSLLAEYQSVEDS
jgi:DNA repair protein SbcC/Rad50